MTFRDLPIRQKLTFVTVLSSIVVLLLATAAFVAYELVTFRHAMVHKLTTEADLLGANITSALVFDDKESATKTLDALHAEPHVVAAAVYRPDGTQFAQYVRPDAASDASRLLDRPGLGGRWHDFVPDGLVVGTDIMLAHEHVGSVRVLSDLGERDARLKSYLGIVASVFVLAVLVGILIASRLQRVISNPILHLVDRAREVTEHQNYGVRATPTGDDELGLLVRTFNEMLTQIQARDTELARARDTAEAANRAKDEFLAVVSHELRTPLTPIVAWTRLLKGGGLDEATSKRALDVIERNARAQTQLVEDLLDVSRIVTGKVRLDVQLVDLRRLIEAAVDATRPGAEAKGVRLQTVVDPRAGAVSGDPQRLQQVFWNLLSNAIKFTPRGGRVQVDLRRVDSHVEVAVSDTGQGIKPEFLPYVFDRFRQADSSSTRAHGGLGIGLAIVRQVVELHGGRVRVDSAGDGQGSVFTVELPAAVVRTVPDDRTHPASASPVPFTPSPVLRGLRVLLVDDEEDTLETLALMLRACGAEVRTAESTPAAIDELRAWRPNAIVSDIGMPEEDGYALIARVRALSGAEGGQTPAIALTAYARTEDRVRALSAGFQMHVAKPIEPAELVATIAAVARSPAGAAPPH
jgi:signal transduction histidine kinase/ActR/RegA family two-component response regulator